MDEPLGYAIGDTLEIIETINSLKGKMPQDVGDVVVALGSLILKLSGYGDDLNKNAETVREVIQSGKAYEKFREIVAAQYGSLEYVDNIEKFKKAQYIIPVYATETGNIEKIDADIIGSIAKYLGAGRMKNAEDVDKTAGIVLNKKIGDSVQIGEVMATIHANDEQKALSSTKILEEAFKITTKKIIMGSRIVEIIK